MKKIIFLLIIFGVVPLFGGCILVALPTILAIGAGAAMEYDPNYQSKFDVARILEGRPVEPYVEKPPVYVNNSGYNPNSVDENPNIVTGGAGTAVLGFAALGPIGAPIFAFGGAFTADTYFKPSKEETDLRALAAERAEKAKEKEPPRESIPVLFQKPTEKELKEAAEYVPKSKEEADKQFREYVPRPAVGVKDNNGVNIVIPNSEDSNDVKQQDEEKSGKIIF